MDRNKRRIHLIAKGCSGRAVTLRDLTPKEKDSALLAAATSVGAQATNVELSMAAGLEQIKLMIVEVSETTSFKDDFRVDPKTKWHKVTRQELDGDGPYGYNSLFTAKDDGFLSALSRQSNEPTPKEIEAIANGAIPLAE